MKRNARLMKRLTAQALQSSHPPTEGEILFANVLTYKRDHGLYVEPCTKF